MRSMCRPLLLAALGSLLSSTCTRALDSPGLSDFPPGAPSCKYTPPNLVRLPSPLPNSLQQAAAKVQNVSQSMLQAPYAPGVQVMAQYKDQTVLEHTAGSANVSSGLPVDPDTLFRIGSVSKLFPTILALQAAASGKIHLDDPLEAVAPDFIMYNPWGPSKVTWRLIMQQRSGLPRECPGGNTTASVLKNLEMYALTYPPGEAPSYSNLGFALMGNLLAERVLGLDFSAAVDKFIISPLGLNNTGFTYTPDILNRLATGYTATVPRQPAAFVDLGWTAPAGSAYSNAREINVLLQAIMSAARGEADPLGLTPAIARAFLDLDYLNFGAHTAWGAPWEVQVQPDAFPVRSKTGSLTTYLSIVSIVPELSLSYVGFWNGAQDTMGQSRAAMADLLPALNTTLWALQPSPLFPQGPQSVNGLYLQQSPGPGGETVSVGVCIFDFAGLGVPSSPLAVTFFMVGDRRQLNEVGWLAYTGQWQGNHRYVQRYVGPGGPSCFGIQGGLVAGSSLVFGEEDGQQMVDIQGVFAGAQAIVPRVGDSSLCHKQALEDLEQHLKAPVPRPDSLRLL